MRNALTFAAALALCAAPAAADHHEEKMTPPDLSGVYKFTGGENGGAKIPTDRLKDNSATVTKDTIAVVDKDKKNLYASKYKVSPSDIKGMWNIDLVSTIPEAGAKAPGLLKVRMMKSDTGEMEVQSFVLIYALPGQDRPDKLKADKGENLFRLKKTADDVDDPSEE